MKKVNKKVRKAYLKALPYICEKCKEFVDKFNEFCPNCGATNSIRNATIKDYDESKTIHKYKAEKRKLKGSCIIGLCLIVTGIICISFGFFFLKKFNESIESYDINYLYFNLSFGLLGWGFLSTFIGTCMCVCGKSKY